MRRIIHRQFVAAVVAAVAGAAMVAGVNGCQQQQRSTKVPQDAMSVGRAQSAPFSWTADRTGTLYVVDVPEDNIVYRGPLRTGQMVTVDPQVNRITVDGRPVAEGKLKSGHRNDIYLKSGPDRNDRPEEADRAGDAR